MKVRKEVYRAGVTGIDTLIMCCSKTGHRKKSEAFTLLYKYITQKMTDKIENQARIGLYYAFLLRAENDFPHEIKRTLEFTTYVVTLYLAELLRSVHGEDVETLDVEIDGETYPLYIHQMPRASDLPEE